VLYAVANRAPAPLSYWDSQRRCRFANDAHATWFGVTPEQMLDCEIGELVGPLYAVSRPHVDAALRGETRQFERDVPDHAGGSSRRVQVTYVPDVVDGAVRGFCVYAVDLARLGGQLAHEINSPLASMFANLERAGHALDDARVDPVIWQPLLSDLRDAALRIGDVIRGVSGMPNVTPVELPAPVEAPARRRRLVVIDDDRMLIRSLERSLAKDYDITAFTDGRAAIAQLASGELDAELVLCDLMMPGATGLDVLRATASIRPELAQRFVLMTGGAPETMWSELASEPTIPVLEKPFQMATLRALLASLAR
jgi:CheY-like chemotaxis protein